MSRPRTPFQSWGDRWRSALQVALLLAALLGGVVLGALSLATEATPLEPTSVTGRASPGVTEQERSDSGYGFVRVTLDVEACGVAFHLLGPSEEVTYRETSTLPGADLHCDRMETFLTHPISLLVVQNERTFAANYTLTLEPFHVTQPYGLVTVPALLLLLVGGIGLTVLLLSRGLRRAEEMLRDRRTREERERREEKGEGGPRRAP